MSFLLILAQGCRREHISLSKKPGELLRVYEIVYDEGTDTNMAIVVFTNAVFEAVRFENSTSGLVHHSRVGPLRVGHLDKYLYSELERSIAENKLWEAVDSVPTCYYGGDDSKTSYPSCVVELRKRAIAISRKSSPAAARKPLE